MVGQEVSEASLAAFVSDQGGNWSESDSQGYLEKGSATIYVNRDLDLTIDYSSDEVQELAKRIGATPKALIYVGISRAPGSDSLAEQFIDAILVRWGGYVDDLMAEIKPTS